LQRPGLSSPVDSVKVKLGSPPLLALSHAVTAEELVTPGDWRCVVFNGGNTASIFDTMVTFPGEIPLDHRTATMDVEFLNLLLAEATSVAGVSWHLQSSASPDDPQSFVRWTNAAIAALAGTPIVQFPIADIRVEHHFDLGTLTWIVLRLLNLDSAPAAPVSAVFFQLDNNAPALSITVTFAPDTARIVAIDSDIDLDAVSIEASVSALEVFVTVELAGAMSATSSGSGTITVAGQQVVDISNDLTITVPKNLNQMLGGVTPAVVRGYVDTLFRPLLRLSPDARIEGYLSDGHTLTVKYAVPLATTTDRSTAHTREG
jgi:hypothetical protein